MDLDVIRGVTSASRLELVTTQVSNDLASLDVRGLAELVSVNIKVDLGNLGLVGDELLVASVKLVPGVL